MGDNADIWRSQPFGECSDEWCDVLSSLPWSIELRSQENCGEFDSISTLALLHDRLCASHISWIAAISGADGPRADAADVRCEKYDVRGGSSPWPLPHSGCSLPGTYVYQGS